MSRLNDLDLRATLQTELESLMYCYLFAATKDLLHWKHADAIPDSYNAKAAAMGTYAVFREKVLARISDAGLRQAAQRLQALFHPDAQHIIDVKAFNTCFGV